MCSSDLIGGYVFSTHWDITKYKSAVEEGQRLYFRAALVAVFLFGLSIFIHFVLTKEVDGYKELILKEASGEFAFLFDTKKEGGSSQALKSELMLVVSIYSLILGSVLWFPLNIIFRILWSLYVRYRQYVMPNSKVVLIPPSFMAAIQDDDFEKLIVTAAARPMPIAFTLENKKVYVGFILDARNPKFKRKAVTILPLMSGIRDPEGRIQFNTFYGPIYSKINDSTTALEHLGADDFKKVIPVERICSSNLFDIEAYEHFLGPNGKKKSTKSKKKVVKKRKAR